MQSCGSKLYLIGSGADPVIRLRGAYSRGAGGGGWMAPPEFKGDTGENSREKKPGKSSKMLLICQIVDISTEVPRSSDPFYIVTYYIKWVTTSWTYGIT